MIIKGNVVSSSAMGRTFYLRALNDKGEIALSQVLQEEDSEKEKIIMQKAKSSEKPLSIVLYFTPAAKLMSEHPRLAAKFRPYTVHNVVERIIKKLDEYGATLFDVSIEVYDGDKKKVTDG